MDEDDGCGSGLSGLAWHELGRQSERWHQVQREATAVFAARLRGERPVGVGDLLANNQALWYQNQQLWQQNQAQQQRINDLQVEMQERWEDFCKIRNWARSEIHRLELENAALGGHIAD